MVIPEELVDEVVLLDGGLWVGGWVEAGRDGRVWVAVLGLSACGCVDEVPLVWVWVGGWVGGWGMHSCTYRTGLEAAVGQLLLELPHGEGVVHHAEFLHVHVHDGFVVLVWFVVVCLCGVGGM